MFQRRFTFTLFLRETDMLDPMARGAQRLGPHERLRVRVVVVVPDLMALDGPLITATATDFAPCTGGNGGGFLDVLSVRFDDVVAHVAEPTG